MQPNEKAPVAEKAVSHLSYADTGFFSRIVLDYLEGDKKLASFYKYTPDIEGIRQAIADRREMKYDRQTLVNALQKQYEGVRTSEKVSANIALLLKDNSFTVTTAHQPNIFTGPLYFIYKILHAIKLAETLNNNFPEQRFIPVYYMGSEDADLDELGHCTVDGKRYEWKTSQTGAVGRMKVDKVFLTLISALEGQLGVFPYGQEIVSVFRDAYREGETLQQCTLQLVNTLFNAYGLVVLIPDNAELKKVFIPVVQKELQEQFSHKTVQHSAIALGKHYKLQAAGRDLNLFYLTGDKRERIELENSRYKIRSLDIDWSLQETENELQQHPERFSPNVILRGVFQEMLLPNIAFIGGGGEIAYWLELKEVFEQASVPYPVLVLRNSFLVVTGEQYALTEALGFDIKDLFRNAADLLQALTIQQSLNDLSLEKEKEDLKNVYHRLRESASKADTTLAEHVSALEAKALKRIDELEKKMLRSEKRKFEAERRKIVKIRSALFPNDSLQERTENISGFYARKGKAFLDTILGHSLSLEQQFTIVII